MWENIWICYLILRVSGLNWPLSFIVYIPFVVIWKLSYLFMFIYLGENVFQIIWHCLPELSWIYFEEHGAWRSWAYERRSWLHGNTSGAIEDGDRADRDSVSSKCIRGRKERRTEYNRRKREEELSFLKLYSVHVKILLWTIKKQCI